MPKTVISSVTRTGRKVDFEVSDFQLGYLMAAVEDVTYQLCESESNQSLIDNLTCSSFEYHSLLELLHSSEKFWQENQKYLQPEYQTTVAVFSDWTYLAGCDLWFTSHHAGAGFWDGDWTETAGKVLTKAAHAVKEWNPWFDMEIRRIRVE